MPTIIEHFSLTRVRAYSSLFGLDHPEVVMYDVRHYIQGKIFHSE